MALAVPTPGAPLLCRLFKRKRLSGTGIVEVVVDSIYEPLTDLAILLRPDVVHTRPVALATFMGHPIARKIQGLRFLAARAAIHGGKIQAYAPNDTARRDLRYIIDALHLQVELPEEPYPAEPAEHALVDEAGLLSGSRGENCVEDGELTSTPATSSQAKREPICRKSSWARGTFRCSNGPRYTPKRDASYRIRTLSCKIVRGA